MNGFWKLPTALGLSTLFCVSTVGATVFDEADLPSGFTRASGLIGSKVENAAGESHAEIVELMVDCSEERVRYAIVRCDDVEDRDFAVPLEEFTEGIDEEGDAVLRLEKDALQRQRSFVRDDFAALERLGLLPEDDQGVEKALPPALKRASKVIGRNVVDSAGEKVGEIEDLVVATQDGAIPYVVLGAGGVLGLGEKVHAVPIRAFGPARGDAAELALAIPKERLGNAPSFGDRVGPDPRDENALTRLREFWGRRAEEGGAARPGTKGGLVRGEEIIGSQVALENGVTVGTIKDVVLTSGNGRIGFAVLEIGDDASLPELEGKNVAVPWEAIDCHDPARACTLNVESSQLRAAQPLEDSEYRQLEDPSYRSSVHRTFGTSARSDDGSPSVVVLSKLIGCDVNSTAGDDIGEVEGLVVDADSGTLECVAVVLDDVDDRLFAVKWREMRVEPGRGQVTLNVDRAQLDRRDTLPRNKTTAGRRAGGE